MFTTYSLYIHCIFTVYSLYIHCIFTICSLYFHYVEMVALLSYFLFLARTTIRICLKIVSQLFKMGISIINDMKSGVNFFCCKKCIKIIRADHRVSSTKNFPAAKSSLEAVGGQILQTYDPRKSTKCKRAS